MENFWRRDVVSDVGEVPVRFWSSRCCVSVACAKNSVERGRLGKLCIEVCFLVNTTLSFFWTAFGESGAFCHLFVWRLLCDVIDHYAWQRRFSSSLPKDVKVLHRIVFGQRTRSFVPIVILLVVHF